MAQGLHEITDEAFEQEVLQEQSKPVLVDFWAPWCGPCRAMSPHMEALSAQYADTLKVVKLNIDDNPKTAAQFGIRSIPTVLLFVKGQQVEQLVGSVSKEDLESLVVAHL